MENNIENNRVIAEFMGWRYVPKSENQFTNEHYERGQDWHSINSFTYHSDWNELNAVVERIEAMGVEIIINFKVVSIEIGETQHQIVGTTKLEATYTAVVKFIEWHNSTSSKNSSS